MSTTSYSSASSSGRRVCSIGVPSKCWCGEEITIFTSKTKDNPYRRFYRCVIALQRENESHLFKWVDEAFADELKIVNEKCNRVAENVRDVRTKMEEEMIETIKKVEAIGKSVGSAVKTVGLAIVIVSSIVWLWGGV
ncbi:putative transcription factor GRF family [Arabidopsis thaliana]